MTFRPALWPTLFTIPALITLIGLGTWQIERLKWKNSILATIEENASLPAIPLPPSDRIDAAALEYRPVTVTGTFRHDKEVHLLATTKRGNTGYQLIVPLDRADGGVVLVNRGWVPKEKKTAESRPESQPQGQVTVTGLLRKTWHQGWFVPDNEPVKNVWFYGDAEAMARHMGVNAPPVFIEADATPNPGILPMGGQTRLDIPNNHLSYVLTWYGFAVVLVVIYIAYHRREGRL